MISDVIGELDELSTHTRIEEQESERIEVVEIDHEFIRFAVTGRIYVQLQYGSDGDVRNDAGVVLSDSFPYSATLASKVMSPTKPLESTVSVSVDTSSFFK
jgi:hypothetical protein